MSNEPFLSRWSRLKRETPATKPVNSKTGETANIGDQSADAANDVVPEDAVDPASLPSLDSILADTDISGFMRRGVPAELTKAALRRAWVADPAIRDFIGIAENQWDFTDPDAMFGFGPLQPTDNVAELVAQATGNMKPVILPESDASEGAKEHVEAVEYKEQPAEAASEKAKADAVFQAPDSGFTVEPQQSIAVQKETRMAERQAFANRRSGGGALPK